MVKIKLFFYINISFIIHKNQSINQIEKNSNEYIKVYLGLIKYINLNLI